MCRLVRLLPLLALPVIGQKVPQFADYPASQAFKGKPAAAKIERAPDRMFRTRIREAAAAGPNFAGKFTIAQWGCGAGCVHTVIVDASNGALYHLPSAEVPCESANQPTCPLNVSCQSGEPFEFKRDSQLLIIHACGKDSKPVHVYLRWTGTKFERLQ
ncbi:MAG: hypothetical protein HYX27_18195 [Acidobacteria bacterium]|nr:hypothetical protein [Acidobacteriota bacterium]